MLANKTFSDESKSTLKWIAAGVAIFGFVYLGNKIFKKIASKDTDNKQTPKKQKSPKTKPKQK